MSDQAEGWHTDASGLRVKKWGPHRETRRRGYERQLQQHQVRRLEGATPSSYASNQPGTLAARGAAARARMAAERKRANLERDRLHHPRRACSGGDHFPRTRHPPHRHRLGRLLS